MRPIIHSKKHIVQLGQSTIAQSAILNVTLFKAIEGASSTPTDIEEGASVKAVWCEVWLSNISASLIGSFTAGLYKNPGNSNVISAADAAALHDYDNKKNILYVTQGLAPATDSSLMLLCRQWFKVPKGKQRMGLGDKIAFFIRNNNATAIDIDVCGIFVYKEYT